MTNEMFDMLMHMYSSHEVFYPVSKVDARFQGIIRLLLHDELLGTCDRLNINDKNGIVQDIHASYYITEYGYMEMEKHRKLFD